MQHFQCIMLYYFETGKNSAERQKKDLCNYREGTVTDQMYQK